MPFRSARKISSYLVRAKLYPLERKEEVCLDTEEADTFRSTAKSESFKINH